MQIHLLKIGKVSYPEIAHLVAMYQIRLRPLVRVHAISCKNDAAAAQALHLPAHIVLLDELGESWTSTQLASQLQQWTDMPDIKNLVFVVGGPQGFAPQSELINRCHRRWALSFGTVTSDLAWLLLWEQIYRAVTIMKRMPYHHG